MRNLFYISIIALLFISCKQEQSALGQDDHGVVIPVLYAKGFTITQYKGYKEIVVRNALDTTKIMQRYRLVDDIKYNSDDAGVMNITVPIHDLASLSTTHLGFIEALDVQDKLIAFSGTKYIYSNVITSLVEAGKIKEVGIEGGLDMELLVQLQPDIVMSYQTGDESYDHFEKMKSMLLKPVVNNEYLELTPLGQAEWIKFIAAFFNLEDKAAGIFDSIANNYNQIKKQAAQVTTQPTVFTGLAYKNEWTVPGGKSFAANYLRDAGAKYIWSSDEKTGNFALSFEEIFSAAQKADYWLNVSSTMSLLQITELDVRNSYFNPFINKKVYNNYARVNAMGGNDYWESAVVYPDRVLTDLVKIFHPELNLGADYYYYIHLQ